MTGQELEESFTDIPSSVLESPSLSVLSSGSSPSIIGSPGHGSSQGTGSLIGSSLASPRGTQPPSFSWPFAHTRIPPSSGPPPAVPKKMVVPSAIIERIHEYIDPKELSYGLICRLALVSPSFYKFYTSEGVWSQVKTDKNKYYLLQSRTKKNIWDSQKVNEWYQKERILERAKLPLDIWNRKKLLDLVVDHVNVICAPSREDFHLYRDDKDKVSLFFKNFPFSEFFLLATERVRSDEDVALEMVKVDPAAIIFCAPKLLNDKEFIKKAIKCHSGKCIEFLMDWREETEMIFFAARFDQSNVKFAKGKARREFRLAKGLSDDDDIYLFFKYIGLFFSPILILLVVHLGLIFLRFIIEFGILVDSVLKTDFVILTKGF